MVAPENIENSTKSFNVPAHIKAIAPYQAGKPIEELAREFGINPNNIIKLASNENPLGLPESARQAIINTIDDLGRYPDANGFELKSALSDQYKVPANWITLGNGSNDLLELISLALLEPGAAVVYSQHAFVVYGLATQARGARHVMVPSQNYGHDLTAMFNAITEQTKLVFIANPNNPTGTFLPAPQLEQFLHNVQQAHGNRVVVVLDEAYTEYLDPELRFNSVQWVQQFPNVIVTRTMSKAYGLAGLRVGFCLAQPQLTDLLNRVRQPFNVNSLAQAAAVAALSDQQFLQKTYELNKQGKQQLEQAFTKLGLQYVPGYGNFILTHFGEKAAHVHMELLKQGVIVRPVASDGLPEWLRISIGLASENDTLIHALNQIIN